MGRGSSVRIASDVEVLAADGKPQRAGLTAAGKCALQALRSSVEVGVDLAPNALRLVLYFDLAAEFLRQAALDEPRAESLPPRRNDRGAVLFRPLQAQPPTVRLVERSPDNADTAFFVRKRAVLDGVGRKLMQRHANRQGHLCGEPHVRPADRKAGRIGVTVGNDRLCSDVAEIGTLPAFVGQDVMGA